MSKEEDDFDRKKFHYRLQFYCIFHFNAQYKHIKQRVIHNFGTLMARIGIFIVISSIF